MGRPTTFTQKLGKRICELISDGASLRSIGEMPNMPSRRTTRTWLGRFPDFEAEYERARRHRADNLVDEIIELSDSVRGSDSPAEVNAARLAVTSRQWVATKLLPATYGDRISQEVSGPNGRDLLAPPEMDTQKIALFLLGIFNDLPGGKNAPATLPARPATAATTLLSGLSEPTEPAPVPVDPEPVETEAMRREHRRWVELTGPRMRVVE